MLRTGRTISALFIAGALLMMGSPAFADVEKDRAEVAALDLEYQAAVKRNDADTMDRIVHEQFYLVSGSGRVVDRNQLIAGARNKDYTYEIQDEVPGSQTVRVWGDTAVVTAKLRVKGVGKKGPFDQTLWFSDTYVRTPKGWRYAFAQVSLPLPPTPPAATASVSAKP